MKLEDNQKYGCNNLSSRKVLCMHDKKDIDGGCLGCRWKNDKPIVECNKKEA